MHWTGRLEHINVTRRARAARSGAAVPTAARRQRGYHITLEVAESIQRRAVRCDDEEYYNMLSAFCNAAGSDADAAYSGSGRLIYAGVTRGSLCGALLCTPARISAPILRHDAGGLRRRRWNSSACQRRCARAQATSYFMQSPVQSVVVAVDGRCGRGTCYRCHAAAFARPVPRREKPGGKG